jgi:hypothetical protein
VIYYIFSFAFASLAIAIGYIAVDLSKQKRISEKRLAAMSSRVADLRKTVYEMKDAIEKLKETQAEGDPDMEQRIADRIEKKWDDGLQSILNFNPLEWRAGE